LRDTTSYDLCHQRAVLPPSGHTALRARRAADRILRRRQWVVIIVESVVPAVVPDGEARVLIAGMSGSGKSSVIAELSARGYRAVDTDDGWCEPTNDGRQRWCEEAIEDLLRAEDGEVLFVAGCEENQGTFRSWFDHVILLTAPRDVLVQRLRTRANNPYGKNPQEFERFLADVNVRDVEPLLRSTADHEVDTRMPLLAVVAVILGAVGLDAW
jgi:shikimate kinase